MFFVLLNVPFAFAFEEYDREKATKFEFSDSIITATEGEYSGYKVKGTSLTINNGGTYVVSGFCSDGSITVKKGTKDVTLVLSGLSLASLETAPISCNKSSAVTIVVADGTVNTLDDSEKTMTKHIRKTAMRKMRS